MSEPEKPAKSKDEQSDPKPKTSRPPVWMAVLSVGVLAAALISGYTAFLNFNQQNNVADIKANTAKLDAEVDSLRARLESEQKTRIRSEEAFSHLSQSLQRYQDHFANVQNEMVQLRYDVNAVRKLPQAEIARRMQALNLLAAEVSVHYAKQQLWLNKRFDLAIAQLEAARTRIVLSEYPDETLLAALDAAIHSLGKMALLHRDERVPERFMRLSKQIDAVPFRRAAEVNTPDEVDLSSKQTWQSRIEASAEQLKDYFIIKKGRTLDFTLLDDQAQLQVNHHIKHLMQQAQKAFQAMDETWYQFNLEEAYTLFREYYDLSDPAAKKWQSGWAALKKRSVQVNEGVLKVVTDKLDAALAQFEPAELLKEETLQPENEGV